MSLPGLPLTNILVWYALAVHCQKNHLNFITKRRKKSNFDHFFIKITYFKYIQLLPAVFGLKFTIETNFVTVYSFAFAGLSLPAGRQYTFMYLLDMLITREPRMRLQKNFRSSVPGPQPKFPPICSTFGRNLFFRNERDSPAHFQTNNSLEQFQTNNSMEHLQTNNSLEHF